MNSIQHKEFAYSFNPSACRECQGFCCSGEPGNVWVNSSEITEIAVFLSMSQVDVIDRYLCRVDNRFSIREQQTAGRYDCVFFDAREKKCSIYGVRPAQCRSFPFWPYYRGREEELLAECPGVRLEK